MEPESKAMRLGPSRRAQLETFGGTWLMACIFFLGFATLGANPIGEPACEEIPIGQISIATHSRTCQWIAEVCTSQTEHA